MAVRLLLSGEFYRRLLELVATASKRVYIATFVFTASRRSAALYYYLQRAVKRGVDVAVAASSTGKAASMNAAALAVLGKLGVPSRLAPGLHAKLYVVDDRVIVGSHNLVMSSEKRLDVSVEVSGPAASAAAEAYRAVVEGGGAGSYSGGGVVFHVNARAFTALRSLLLSARETAVAVVSRAGVDREVWRLYSGLAARSAALGVEAWVLAGPHCGNVEACRMARRAGLSFSISRLPLHAKYYISDGRVLVGSVNLTTSPYKGRRELAAEIRDAGLAAALFYIASRIPTMPGCICPQLNSPKPLCKGAQ